MSVVSILSISISYFFESFRKILMLIYQHTQFNKTTATTSSEKKEQNANFNIERILLLSFILCYRLFCHFEHFNDVFVLFLFLFLLFLSSILLVS